MSASALHALTALQLAEGYADGAFSPVDAVTAIHRRIDAVNPRINAVIAEDRASALTTARASEERWAAGMPLSPLDGIPVTVKDNIHVAGLPARWGSRLHDDGQAVEDELPVRRLRDAGLVVIGKTNVPEFTVQGYTDNPLFGVTVNPLAPDRTPGGSTGGGAAAVAAGIAPLAIGTDGGGSIRRPAAHCGLYGFKPSIGQVARAGGFPQILADFEVVGPLARTARDLVALFDLMCGRDPADPRSLLAEATSPPFATPPRIGYFSGIGEAPVDPRIVAAADAFADRLAQSGCAVEPIAAPFDATEVNGAWGAVAQAGIAWHLGRHREQLHLIGENAKAMAEVGSRLSATDLVAALDMTAALRGRAGLLFSRYDMLLCPSTAALAWPAAEPYPPRIAGREAGPRGHAIFTAWMNVCGLAAVSVPVASTPDAGGIGMQLVAAQGSDRRLLDFVLGNSAIQPLPAVAKDLT